MKRYYLIVLTVVVFVIATGTSNALAGGSSDTSGEGSHCYLFFELPDGKFAQAMVNDSEPGVVLYKVDELIEKYEGDEEGTLVLSVGSIVGSDFCAPVIEVNSIEGIANVIDVRWDPDKKGFGFVTFSVNLAEWEYEKEEEVIQK